ncbi:peptide-binding protein [Salipiger sp. P9]|uniref:SH3 domain-containing protein n=1 Tax=Salipiger pentaromativorans TaxID=2943193 RepID=UPI002157B716|nr:SH3 domain-containing protein [Salipiger pentaromativorans]MCR8548752.1 peptide-binding protein [Salipiger pentaromativorans]
MFPKGVFLAMGLCLATPLAAQDLPALFDVTGVAANDVLNVRAAPDAAAPVVGALAHNAQFVEVTAVNAAGTWGRVNLGEGAGWASLSFLAMQAGSVLPDAQEVTCFGTEPFWSYSVTADGEATWSAIDDEVVTMRAGPIRRADARFEPFVSVAGGPDQQGVLVMHKDPQCSDGMSDNLYGLSATVVLTGKLSRAVSGCCSLELP